MVGIAGGSGSGKGTIAGLIRKNLEEFGLSSAILCTDNFYNDFSHLTERERDDMCFNPEMNYDHPRSIDFARLLGLANKLKNGEAFNYRKYNFNTHTYDADSEIGEVDANLDIGIVEGNFALYNGSDVGKSSGFGDNDLLELYDYKLFVTTSQVISLNRRLTRDRDERGRDVSHSQKQISSTVHPMYLRFIHPTSLYSDDQIKWENDLGCSPNDSDNKLNRLARQKAFTIYEAVRGKLSLGKK